MEDTLNKSKDNISNRAPWLIIIIIIILIMTLLDNTITGRTCSSHCSCCLSGLCPVWNTWSHAGCLKGINMLLV